MTIMVHLGHTELVVWRAAINYEAVDLADCRTAVCIGRTRRPLEELEDMLSDAVEVEILAGL